MIKHERNENIALDKDRHIYTYKDDQIFKGVTSWIGKYNKPFDAEKVAKKLAKWRGQKPEDILAEWEETREYGDYVHELIENYVNDDQNFNVPEIENFESVIEKHDLVPICSEWVVYDEDIKRASAVDLICTNHKNQYVAIDIKTRHKGIEVSSYQDQRMFPPLDDLPASRYFKYCLQVNIYKYWLENKYDLNMSSVNYILNLTDEGYELIPVVDLTGKVEQMYSEI